MVVAHKRVHCGDKFTVMSFASAFTNCGQLSQVKVSATVKVWMSNVYSAASADVNRNANHNLTLTLTLPEF